MYVIHWKFKFFTGFDCQAAVVISVIPVDGKITLGGSVKVQCSVVNKNSNDSLFWYRGQGDIRYKIGIDDVFTTNNGDVGNNRYGLQPVDIKDNTRVYTLTLTGETRFYILALYNRFICAFIIQFPKLLRQLQLLSVPFLLLEKLLPSC